MANPDISAKSFLNELMDISLHLIWKDPYYVVANESAETKMEAEAYVAARNGDLYFNSVYQFHEEVLQGFFPDPDELAIVLLNKRMIPDELRDAIVQAEAEYLIDYWENRDGETNAYYRMLFGLPPIDTDESDYVYNTRYADIDMTTPIHKLPYTERLKLENRGYLDELMAEEANADKLYLKYLGKYRIYPYVARQAENFQLLYVQPSNYDYLRNDFIDTYEEARRMVIRVYYNDAYRNNSHLYEGFLGMCILFITQQRMYAKYLEADVDRNFYDLQSLKLVYDAYGMPFYSSIPLKYHEKIVKHMNELISYKGSTQVFYDLFDLFDFGKMDVFEYFLVKERKTDSDGNPVFRDKDGNALSEEDKWNLRFAKVGWKDNKFVEVTDPDNVVEYDKLTTVDPYWVEDSNLKKKLYESDWNYFHSKYMGVQLMFELSKLLFEMCYFLHLLEDNRSTLSKLTTYYSMIAEDVPIFDMVIYTIAVMCKNAGYTGEIPSDPASVAAIYGFNFKEYNSLMKMGTEDMSDFVVNFKKECTDFAKANAALAADDTLLWLIDHITGGAFNYLGDDFPYNEWGYAPSPVFLKDYWPTRNSVEAVRSYLKGTIDVLKSDATLSEFEIIQLYQRLVTKDNYEFKVLTDPSLGDQGYETFLLKNRDFDEEDVQTLRNAVIASYEHMLAWMIKLLDTRRALTYDPHIMELINNMNVDSVDDVDRLYKNMEELDEYLSYRIRKAQHKDEYEAFANLRKILMTTHLVTETFTKRNGEVASTYEDLLQDINSTLYNRLNNDDLDMETEEQYAIQTLMKLCDDLELMESMNTDNIRRIVEHLFKILAFIKSAKVDLTEFQIIYLITDRGMNYIKLIGELWEQDVTHLPWKVDPDKFYLLDNGMPWAIFIVQYFLDRVYLVDQKHAMKVQYLLTSSFEDLTDLLLQNVEQYGYSSLEYLFDWLHDEVLHIKVLEDARFFELIKTDTEGMTPTSDFDWSTTLKQIGDMIVKIADGIMLQIKNNHFELTDAQVEHLDLMTDEFHLAVINEEPINDAIMMQDTLIKVEDSSEDVT
jgi:hypothetical protein